MAPRTRSAYPKGPMSLLNGSKKKKKKKSEGPPDLLSNLPTGIITEILGHVPICDAVRTSVLSRHWRHLWCSIPNLKFDDGCVDLWGHDEDFTRFVYRVLLIHQGPVRKFAISGYSFPQFSDINQWVTFVSRNGVEELSLQFGYYAEAPSSLFKCNKLTAMTLRLFQSLELPVSFEGFKSLKSLVLESVTIAICSLEKLISGCPLLERLELCNSHSGVLKIHAPLLKYLYLDGAFEGFILEKTPLLEEISVAITSDVTEHSCTLIQFIDRVPSLQKLIGLEYFTKYWNVGKDPTILTITHNHLRFIKLSINFEDPTEVRLLIRLLSRSPVLKELKIIGARRESSSEGRASSDWELCSEAHDLGCQLSQLKKVTVTVSGSSSEIGFVKFVLLNSPVLEKIEVLRMEEVWENDLSDLKDGRMKILVDLLRCRRASTMAEVVFCDG